MAIGNSKFFKDIIDDTNSSIRTTYSSDKIESIMTQTGTTNTIFLLTVSDTAPTTAAIHDKYYNTKTELIYEINDSGKWDSGKNPTRNTLYIDNETNKMYIYKKGKFEDCSGITRISSKENNAIVQLSGEDDGLYVKNISERVNQINLAQKTTNKPGEVSLIDGPYAFTTNPATTVGNPVTTRIEHNLILKDSISNYTEIQIIISMGGPNTFKRVAQPNIFKVDSIGFNPASESADYSDAYATLVCTNTTPSGVDGTFGNLKYTMTCWFKDDRTLHLHTFYNPHTNSRTTEFQVDDVIGVKTETVTIDPVNYIDTNQGIQDTPVGTVIRYNGSEAPAHYIRSNGSLYNIKDYPHLAQNFEDNFGKINFFGGDGETTFGTKKYEDETIDAYLPEEHTQEKSGTITANTWYTDSNTGIRAMYNMTYSASNPLNIFNGRINTAGASETDEVDYIFHSANAANGHVLTMDMTKQITINGFRMFPRGGWPQRLPKSFSFEGSNDGTTWDVIQSYTNQSYTNAKWKEFRFLTSVTYQYFRLNNMGTVNNYINIAEFEFIKEIPIEIYCIKAEPTYFIDTVTGYEQVDELLDNPVDIPAVDPTTLRYYVVSKGVTTDQDVCFAYNTAPVGSTITLNKSYADFDEIEIVAYGINPQANERFNRITERIRVSDLIYSDSISFADGSIDLQFSAISSGFRNQQVRLNFKTDKKTLTVVQTNYWQGPIARNSIITWTSIRIDKVRGIKKIYKLN